MDSTGDEWDSYFQDQNDKMEEVLGLKKAKRKRKEGTWYYPRRDPKTGLIPSKTKERKRSSSIKGMAKESTIDDLSKDNVNQMDFIPEEHNVEEDDMQSILQELQTALDIDLHDEHQDSWNERQEDLDASWIEKRQDIVSFMMKKKCPPNLNHANKTCDKCSVKSAVLRCRDCMEYFCDDCDATTHFQLFLHDRETWENGYFCRIPKAAAFPVIHPVKCSGCGVEGQSAARNTGSYYIAITLKGRRSIQRAEVYCKSCQFVDSKLELEGIIANGFWPATIRRIIHIYEMDLLNLIDMFMKNMPGTSLSSIARAIQDLDESVKTVSKVALSRALMEYRYCHQALKEARGTDGMSCPACSHGQHSAHVDGNFKVYRYSKVPRGSRQRYYEDLFIAPQKDVSKHLEAVYSSRRRHAEGESDMCGNTHWRAAKSSARANSKLDECGLEVAGCRHAVAQKAVNMYSGEQYAYPHFLQIHFLMPLKVEFMWQDVICKYWPWATKQGQKNALFAQAVDTMKPALSVMHAKAHQWACQVIWGGRNQEGSCAGAGEDMEQFFSHLSRLGSTTKNMSSAGREDNITEHVLFWNRRKAVGMAEQLCKRYKQNELYMSVAEEELTSYRSSLAKDVSDADLQKWKEEILHRAKDAGEETDVTAAENQIEAVALSIRQRKVAINKFADSSKQRVRLRRKNEKERAKLEELLEKLSSIPGGRQLSLADAIGGNFPWHSDSPSSSSLAFESKKKMVDLWVLSHRYREEKVQLKKEMKSVLRFYQEKISKLQDEKSSLSDMASHEEMAPLHEQVSGRYTCTLHQEPARNGLIAIKLEGMYKAKQCLAAAVLAFRNSLNGMVQLDSTSSETSNDSSS